MTELSDEKRQLIRDEVHAVMESYLSVLESVCETIEHQIMLIITHQAPRKGGTT